MLILDPIKHKDIILQYTKTSYKWVIIYLLSTFKMILESKRMKKAKSKEIHLYNRLSSDEDFVALILYKLEDKSLLKKHSLSNGGFYLTSLAHPYDTDLSAKRFDERYGTVGNGDRQVLRLLLLSRLCK